MLGFFKFSPRRWKSEYCRSPYQTMSSGKLIRTLPPLLRDTCNICINANSCSIGNIRRKNCMPIRYTNHLLDDDVRVTVNLFVKLTKPQLLKYGRSIEGSVLLQTYWDQKDSQGKSISVSIVFHFRVRENTFSSCFVWADSANKFLWLHH